MGLFETLQSISNSLVENPILIKTITSLIILLIGLVLGRIAGKLLLRLLRQIDFDSTIKKTTGYTGSIVSIISKFVTYLIYFLTILIILENLGLTSFVLNLIMFIILTVIAISVVLAIKDFIPNFVAGYSIRNKGLFKVGDKIKVGDVEGKIVKIMLVETHIESRKDLIVVPNSYFLKHMIVKKK